MVNESKPIKDLESKLLFETTVRAEIEKELAKALLQAKKDANLNYELVIINEFFLEEHKKLKSTIHFLENVVKNLSHDLKQYQSPSAQAEHEIHERMLQARSDAMQMNGKGMQFSSRPTPQRHSAHNPKPASSQGKHKKRP